MWTIESHKELCKNLFWFAIEENEFFLLEQKLKEVSETKESEQKKTAKRDRYYRGCTLYKSIQTEFLEIEQIQFRIKISNKIINQANSKGQDDEIVIAVADSLEKIKYHWKKLEHLIFQFKNVALYPFGGNSIEYSFKNLLEFLLLEIMVIQKEEAEIQGVPDEVHVEDKKKIKDKVFLEKPEKKSRRKKSKSALKKRVEKKESFQVTRQRSKSQEITKLDLEGLTGSSNGPIGEESHTAGNKVHKNFSEEITEDDLRATTERRSAINILIPDIHETISKKSTHEYFERFKLNEKLIQARNCFIISKNQETNQEKIIFGCLILSERHICFFSEKVAENLCFDLFTLNKIEKLESKHSGQGVGGLGRILNFPNSLIIKNSSNKLFVFAGVGNIRRFLESTEKIIEKFWKKSIKKIEKNKKKKRKILKLKKEEPKKEINLTKKIFLFKKNHFSSQAQEKEEDEKKKQENLFQYYLLPENEKEFLFSFHHLVTCTFPSDYQISDGVLMFLPIYVDPIKISLFVSEKFSFIMSKIRRNSVLIDLNYQKIKSVEINAKNHELIIYFIDFRSVLIIQEINTNFANLLINHWENATAKLKAEKFLCYFDFGSFEQHQEIEESQKEYSLLDNSSENATGTISSPRGSISESTPNWNEKACENTKAKRKESVTFNESSIESSKHMKAGRKESASTNENSIENSGSTDTSMMSPRESATSAPNMEIKEKSKTAPHFHSHHAHTDKHPSTDPPPRTFANQNLKTEFFYFNIFLNNSKIPFYSPPPNVEKEKLEFIESKLIKNGHLIEKWKLYFSLYGRTITRSNLLKRLLFLGIPNYLRAFVWSWLAFRTTKYEENSYIDFFLLYSQFKSLKNQNKKKDLSGNNGKSHKNSYSLVYSQIKRDIHRSFPDHPFYQCSFGKKSLKYLLFIYSVRNPKIGYCQSMNFISSFLLLYFPINIAFQFLSFTCGLFFTFSLSFFPSSLPFFLPPLSLFSFSLLPLFTCFFLPSPLPL